jgi:hypothetical protein
LCKLDFQEENVFFSRTFWVCIKKNELKKNLYKKKCIRLTEEFYTIGLKSDRIYICSCYWRVFTSEIKGECSSEVTLVCKKKIYAVFFLCKKKWFEKNLYIFKEKWLLLSEMKYLVISFLGGSEYPFVFVFYFFSTNHLSKITLLPQK